MEISAESVRELRARTGAGVMECKRALKEAEGDPERALEILRERGKIQAAKKADRVAGEGLIGVYVHTTGKVAALVALRCETDFVARSETFQELAKDLAMHVVAMDPLAVRPDELPTGGGERALLAQPFVKDPEMTVGDLIALKIAEFGENIIVETFARLAL